MISVPILGTFDDWRLKARGLLGEKVHFDEIDWQTGGSGFSFGESWTPPVLTHELNIPKSFMDLARVVSTFRDDSTWSLLYRLAWRLLYENKKLMEIEIDTDVKEFMARHKLVKRDAHKMKAFVRFKEIVEDDQKIYVAWHRPDHKIVRLIAPFFKDRFNGMNWVIMTDDETVSWDGKEITFSEGVPKEKAPKDDQAEDLWKTYYRAIFNPARIKISAMKKELPVRHWKTLPETELITELIDEAPDRLEEFYASQKPAAIAENKIFTFPEVKEALNGCRACGICEKATAPVMGEGPLDSKIMFIGEQPGNEEDLKGKPFIGPAGKLLNQAFEDTGFDRKEMYVTNAVKGFKWIQQNSMRWHRTANGTEIAACKPWLKQEISIVKPKIIVCLGRTAAQSVIGKMIKLEDVRGKFFKTQYSDNTIVLPHPASILRADKDIQDEMFERFKEELEIIKKAM